jgi:hypothetical protein
MSQPISVLLIIFILLHGWSGKHSKITLFHLHRFLATGLLLLTTSLEVTMVSEAREKKLLLSENYWQKREYSLINKAIY